MRKSVLASLFLLLFLRPSFAQANCFSRVSESTDGSRSGKTATTHEEREYMSERYRVSVDVRGWTLTDFETGETLQVDTQGRSYRKSSLQQLLLTSIEGSKGLAKLGGQLPVPPPPKATGKKLKFGGVGCDESLQTTQMNMGEISMTLEIFTCGNRQEPAAYFPLARTHARKFNELITPELRARITRFSATLPPALKAMLENAGQQGPSFTVQNRTPPPRIAGKSLPMGPVKESRTTLKSWGSECPPSRYLTPPAGFRMEKSGR